MLPSLYQSRPRTFVFVGIRADVELRSPVSIRIANAHLAFLPNVLLALYSAKPLRDQILGLDLSPLLGLLPGAPPPEAASGRQPVDKAVVERYTAVAKYWRGEQANIFAEDDTPRTPVERASQTPPFPTL